MVIKNTGTLHFLIAIMALNPLALVLPPELLTRHIFSGACIKGDLTQIGELWFNIVFENNQINNGLI